MRASTNEREHEGITRMSVSMRALPVAAATRREAEMKGHTLTGMHRLCNSRNLYDTFYGAIYDTFYDTFDDAFIDTCARRCVTWRRLAEASSGLRGSALKEC
eukprot:358342-Chlamydomonas_euryale.AAC.3